MKILLLPVVLFLLQIADCVTTGLALNLSPNAYELNPIPALMGWHWAIVIKILGGLLCAGLLNYVLVQRNKSARICGYVIGGLITLMYVGVVINNSLIAFP